MSKLNHIITDADVERLKQKREYDVVINERDILGTQVGSLQAQVYSLSFAPAFCLPLSVLIGSSYDGTTS